MSRSCVRRWWAGLAISAGPRRSGRCCEMRFSSHHDHLEKTIMTFDARRVLVSIDEGENALSIVDQPKAMRVSPCRRCAFREPVVGRVFRGSDRAGAVG